jgi:hypothetical protein
MATFWETLLEDRWAHVTIIIGVVLFACWISWMFSAVNSGSTSTLLSLPDENALGVLLVRKAKSLLIGMEREQSPVRRLIYATSALSFLDAAEKTSQFQSSLEQETKQDISKLRNAIEAYYHSAQNQVTQTENVVSRSLWSL